MAHRFDILTFGEHHWAILEKVLADLTGPSGNSLFDVRTGGLTGEHGGARSIPLTPPFYIFRISR
jgi:hypothetical protein